jgi:hypothetical protein
MRHQAPHALIAFIASNLFLPDNYKNYKTKIDHKININNNLNKKVNKVNKTRPRKRIIASLKNKDFYLIRLIVKVKGKLAKNSNIKATLRMVAVVYRLA